MLVVHNTTPVRLRPMVGNSIGTTAFFRNRALFDTLLEDMKSRGQISYNVMFHACSIGAEVYSFLIAYLTGGFEKYFTLQITATDREQGFLDFAALGGYPIAVTKSMSPVEKAFFGVNNSEANVVDKVRQSIRFLAASSFVDYSCDDSLDVVVLLNALIYVPAELQAKTIDRIANYNTGLLVISAFHNDFIKQDLVRNGYRPILKNIKAIHDGWKDRRVIVQGDELRTGIYAKWSLPEFSEIEEFEFKYCAIFEKC